MRISIQADAGELAEKSQKVLHHLAQALGSESPVLAEALHKAAHAALPDETGLAAEPQRAMQEIRDKMREAYEAQMRAMVAEIGQVVDAAAKETPPLQTLTPGVA